MRLSIFDVIKKLKEVNEGSFNKAWSEGYISALADHAVISEHVYDEALHFISEQ